MIKKEKYIICNNTKKYVRITVRNCTNMDTLTNIMCV